MLEPISKRLKSVTPAKAGAHKINENTGYRYGCAWRLGKQHYVSGFRRNYNNRLLNLARWKKFLCPDSLEYEFVLPEILRTAERIIMDSLYHKEK